ncbi:hypothetical protein LJD47_33420, partial [Escherichia coli]|nr:hypothetical protein [Escherichia coli]
AIDIEAARARIGTVGTRSQPSASLLRVALLGVLAALLLLRLGPWCEAAASAAPVAPVMAGCD